MAADSTPEEEVRRLERHYSVNPEGLVFARLADAYRRSGRLERSLELLREGLERHPDYTTGHLIEGRALREAGRPEEAAASFRRVLQLDAGNLVALRSLAELAAERGDMDEAHRWTDRLEQADPFTSFDPADAAARARERDTPPPGDAGPGDAPGETGPPEDDLPEAGQEPGQGDASTTLPGEEGLASEIAAMADEQWWSSATEDTPVDEGEGDDSDVSTETMAHLYAQQGLYEEAAEVYRRLLERRPDDDRLRRRLDEMTRRAGGDAAATGAAERQEGRAPADDETGSSPRGTGEAAGREEPVAYGGTEVSARDHFRALLRGRARPTGAGADERARQAGAAGADPSGGRQGTAGEAAG